MSRLLYIFRIASNYQKLWENSFSPTTFPTLVVEERGIYVVKCTETVWGKWEGEDSYEWGFFFLLMQDFIPQ